MHDWANFFIATTGAAAALSGTLLVAMSINITRIIGQPTLPGRAANTLIIVGSSLVISAVALAPARTVLVLGWAAAIVGAGLLYSAAHLGRLLIAKREHDLSTIRTVLGLAGPTLVPLPFLIGGGMLITQNSAGISLIAIAVLISVAVALQNSWVLLVEILR